MLYQGARVVCAIAILGALVGCAEIPQPQSQSQPHVHQPQSQPEPQRHVHHADESGPGGVDVQHLTHSPTVQHDWWHQHAHWEGYNLRHEHVHVLGEEHDPPESWRNPPSPPARPPTPAETPPAAPPSGPPRLGPPGEPAPVPLGEQDGKRYAWELNAVRLGLGWSGPGPIPEGRINRHTFEWDRITGGSQSICITIGGKQLPLQSTSADPLWLWWTTDDDSWAVDWSVSAEIRTGAIVLVFSGNHILSPGPGEQLYTSAHYAVHNKILLVELEECAGG